MIKIPYKDIISKIMQSANLTEEQVNQKIKSKMDQLAGLISKDGAAHIIANELGVKLFESYEGKMKIDKILPGMRSIEIIGKVTNIYEVKEFDRQDGAKGKVASIVVGDENGTIRVVFWNEQTDKLKEISLQTVIKINELYVKENNTGKTELHLSGKSQITINPLGEKIEQIAKPQIQKASRKKIQELTDKDLNVEIFATIVQIFEPKFYEVCPDCNKRIKEKEGKFSCLTHGEVAPSYAFLVNLILDDGSSTIRTVFFRNQVLNLLKMNNEQIMKFKEFPQEFQSIKEKLLGNVIKVVGRVSKNEMFDRLEFIAQLVFPEPDPNEELKRLEEQAEIIE